MVKHVNQLLNAVTTVKRSAIHLANASLIKKSLWIKDVGNAAEKSEVPAVTDAKNDVTQLSLVLKSLVKLRYVSIANAATDLSRRFASQALKSLLSNAILDAGRNNAMKRLLVLSEAVLTSQRTRVQSTSNTTRKKQFNSLKKTLSGLKRSKAL